MIISGVDPGKTGAMVTLFEDGSTIVDRVPIEKVKGKKDRPHFLDWSRTWRASIDFNQPDIFMVEQVGARPEQGSVATFNFGKSMGFAMGIIYAYDIPVHYETPSVWKEKMGLVGFDKSASITLARDLVPSIVPELDRKLKGNTAEVKHGIAEAALLAYYAKKTIRDTT